MLARSLHRALALLVLATPTYAQLAMSPQPSLRIGSEVSADYQFNRISHLRRLSDGRIVVTTGPDIRFFDGSGKFLSRAGGRGRGPGEYQYVNVLIVMPGDSLLTLNLRTIIVLDPQGKFVRQSQLDLAPLSVGDWYTEGSVLLPNGNLLAPQYSREQGAARNPALHRPKLRYAILDIPTARVTPLHQGGGIAQQYVNGEPIVMPFFPHEQVAVGADRVYVGDNDSTTIHSFDLSGKPLGTIQVASEPVPVTAAELEAYKAREMEWLVPRRMTEQAFDLRWSSGPKPKRHPYWGTALVDATGVLWVSASPRMGGEPLAWTAWNRSGRRVASITMPLRFTPKEIGADYVLGVQVDEDGVETIAMYALRRR
jgi:hypothetical protein